MVSHPWHRRSGGGGFLTNYRPEYQHTWGNKTYYTQLRIDPLPPETAEGLLEALLGPDSSLAPLKQLLIARTGGNPLFLEESVRTLVETKVIVGERGTYRQVRPVENIQVPATVQALLAARIDRLVPEHKRLLQSASVIGKDVPFRILQVVAEAPEEELAGGLAQLRAVEFLYETSLFPDLEYTFKHALTQEVAYGSLLQERRRELHARILRVIEELYPDRLGVQAERLAQHALRGEVWERAVAYLRQAASRAAARAAYWETVALLDQALDALAHLPQSRERDEQAIDLRLELRHVLFPLGEFGLLGERLREAEKVAVALNDPERLRRVTSYLAQEFRAWGIASLRVLIGEHRRATDSAHRAFDSAAAGGDYAREIMAAYTLGEAYHALGDYRRALDFLTRNLEVLQADRERERFSRLGFAGLPSVFSHAWAVRCLAELGEFPPAVVHAEDALRIAGLAGETVDLLEAHAAAGELHLRQGNLQKAVTFFERCLELIPAPEHPYWFPIIGSSLGSAYAHLGRPGVAIPLLEKAVEQAASSRLMGSQALRLTHLARGVSLSRATGERQGDRRACPESCRLIRRRRAPGLDPLFAGGGRRPRRFCRRWRSRGLLRSGHCSGECAGHAPAARTLPTRPRDAVSAGGQRSKSGCRAIRRGGSVPSNGNGVMVDPRRGRTGQRPGAVTAVPMRQ